MSFFQNSVLNKHLKTLNNEVVKEAYEKFTSYFLNPVIQQNIRDAKEEQFQEGFLRELFVKILGYNINPEPNYNLTTEFKNEKGSKKADGAILKDGKALGVIELKGTDTKDLDRINVQAFNYKNNQTGCIYVVTSNFEKLRFFIQDSVNHKEFNLFTLTQSEFSELWLCLQVDNLIANIPLKIKEESVVEEETITKKLYKDYATFKFELWQNVCKNMPEQDPLLLFKKSQKLLDRFLFIFFSEDSGLLPPNSISRMVERYEQLIELDAKKTLYDIFKQYFGYINIGREGKTRPDDIFAYNGGLFLNDVVLDGFIIDDDLLKKHVLQLTSYDFQSEVDVNILGHIFENSLNEIENITAQLEGQEVDKTKSKRKKDGVYYTPKYITKYIVENTIGKLCEAKKAELNITDERFAQAGKRTKKGIGDLQAYRDWLLDLKICDPACGSGAFLNQALEFLIDEHQYLDELTAQYHKAAIMFQDVSIHILENNIYGVDINEESVEIAKLSLWLRTAQRGRKLTSLNNNIKCGNSLIDDPEVAGEKAFKWQEEFSEVFAKDGFDVVIGNPPYGVNIQVGKEYFKENYRSTEGPFELYKYFIEKSIKLIRKKGVLGFITPDTWVNLSYFKKLRQIIFSEFTLVKCSESLYDIFEDAVVDTCIFIIENTDSNSDNFVAINRNLLSEFDAEIKSNENDFILNFKPPSPIIKKIDKYSLKLGSECEIWRGMSAYGAKNPERPYNSMSKDSEHHKKLLNGGDIGKYLISWKGEYIKYGDWLHRPRPEYIYSNPKILIQRIRNPKLKDRIVAVYDEEKYISSDGLSNVLINAESIYTLKSLLGILNSKLINYWFSYYYFDVNIKPEQLRQIPLPNNFNIIELNNVVSNLLSLNKELSSLTQKFGQLVLQKFELKNLSKKIYNLYELEFYDFLKELKKAKVKLSLAEEAEWMQYFNDQKQKAQKLKAEIDNTDKEIDQMVYDLYELTDEEIKFVEKLN